MILTYANLLNFYGEDLAMQPEDFFEMLAKFATMLAAAHAENETRKRREEYQMKRTMRQIVPPSKDAGDAGPQKLKATQANAHGSAHAQGVGAPPAPAMDAGIDSILQHIQTGGVQAIVSRRPTLGMQGHAKRGRGRGRG